ncbi:MAG: nucleoid-associated protein, partial [Ginsengibacter sp.]
MISYFQATLSNPTIHKVGNKLLDEHLSLSEHPLKTDDEVLDNLLMNYFLKPFEKVNEIYRFDHSTGDLNLNEVYHFAEIIFNDKDTFHENSRQIAKHLYDI